MSDLQGPAEGRRGRLARRLLVAGGLIVLLLLAAAVVFIGPLLFEKNAYAGVPSIERDVRFRDPQLMRSAWALPVARRYAAGGFEYQANPSFCGPTSVADLMKSVGRPMDQKQAISGAGYQPVFGLLIKGLTLDQEAELLSRKLGRPVQVVRDPSLQEFRGWMRRANDPNLRIIVNFHRGPMFGRGHGHFSPVLGYLEQQDLVLVGDVNASYRPYLAPSERLWRATDTVDDATGKERGLIVAQVAPRGG